MGTVPCWKDSLLGVASAPENAELPWFAIQVRSRSELRAYNELSTRVFECFLPLCKVRRRWSDRVKTVDEPLFPGYLFSRFDLANRSRILSSSGVAQIVGCGNSPVPVEEREIQSIQTLIASKVAIFPWPCLGIGQHVRISHGPLAGVEGIVVRADDGKPRIVVSVYLLQRAVCAVVDRDWIC